MFSGLMWSYSTEDVGNQADTLPDPIQPRMLTFQWKSNKQYMNYQKYLFNENPFPVAQSSRRDLFLVKKDISGKIHFWNISRNVIKKIRSKIPRRSVPITSQIDKKSYKL